MTSHGNIVSICISRQKHTAKMQVPCARLQKDFGIVTDAHAGCGHRQISFLMRSSIEKMRTKKQDIAYGMFGENIVVDGIQICAFEIGTRLHLGSQAVVEITQIGKECHSPCVIYKQAGYCIMPQEGVFARVVESGEIYPGDPIRLARAAALYH